ncbi:MAG: acetyl-CoA C-acetyltransferase [Candidatus Carbobacillus altaicus]|nr:acetyl-CoA C-acetyltransferase [Candidatus Carbobacillus altaicus]
MNIAIVAGKRTPFGKFQGALKRRSAVELGGLSLQAVLRQAAPEEDQASALKEAIDHVILGTVITAGLGQVPARQAARSAGLPWHTSAETINKVCASGMRAITLGETMIRAGDAELILAGGMENMSRAPHALLDVRDGWRMGDRRAVDLMLNDGLMCPFYDVHMAVHGSRVAKEYGVDRAAQDAFALESHRRAIRAIDAGYFDEEIVPVEDPAGQKGGGPGLVKYDESPRRDTSLKKLAQLPPVFEPDGTITAGNAPGVNDGAAAVLLASEEARERFSLPKLATILGHAMIAEEAPYIATAPARAIQKLLQKTGYTLEDIDLLEINEAFAAVPLVSAKLLGLSSHDIETRLNINGGAVALGHPIGASGARLVLTLAYALIRRGGGLGIAAICSGTGQGDAVLIRVDDR